MVQFEEYCNNTPALYFLQCSHKVAADRRKLVNKQPITTLQPGVIFCIDICTWGEQWYQSIGLPDMFNACYVDKWEVTGWWKKESFSSVVSSSIMS